MNGLLGAIISAAGLSAQVATPAAFLPDETLPGLRSLLQQAVSQSPETLTASIDLARSEAQRLVDASQLYPQISASLRYAGIQSKIAGTSTESSRNVGLFYDVNVNQPLYHFGALKAQADIGKLGVEISKQNFEQAYRALALTVRSQYLALITQKINLRYKMEALKQEEASLKVLEQKLAAGSASPAELAEPRLAMAESRIASDRLAEDYEQSRRTLATLCGVPEIADSEIPSEFPAIPGNEEDFNRLLSLTKSVDADSLPQAKIYKATARQGDLNYKIARARVLPKISLYANMNQSNSTTAVTNAVNQYNITQQTLGVMANWQIFDGFAARGSKIIAIQQKRRANQDLEAYRKQVAAQVERDAHEISYTRRSHDILQTRFSINRNSTEKVEADMRAGLAAQDFLDQVRNQQNDSEVLLLRSRADLFDKIGSYLSLLGQDPALQYIPSRITSNGRN